MEVTTYKKKAIPKNIKIKVWNEYIGKTIVESKCYVCNDNTIFIYDFEAGHVVAESLGGSNTVENLRPICSRCNKSMRTMNLYEYKEMWYPDKKQQKQIVKVEKQTKEDQFKKEIYTKILLLLNIQNDCVEYTWLTKDWHSIVDTFLKPIESNIESHNFLQSACKIFNIEYNRGTKLSDLTFVVNRINSIFDKMKEYILEIQYTKSIGNIDGETWYDFQERIYSELIESQQWKNKHQDIQKEIARLWKEKKEIAGRGGTRRIISQIKLFKRNQSKHILLHNPEFSSTKFQTCFAYL